ncbi:MAG: Ig-like domain-containing protein, partial [Gemmatimonadaceae bacterium]
MRGRRRYLAIAAALTLLGCSGGKNDNPVEPHPDEIASIEISLPVGRSNVMAISDTVTLTATVLDRTGNRVESGVVTWVAQNGQAPVTTGSRTALLTVARGANDIKASIREKYFSNPLSATISLLGRTTPEVFIWNPGGALERVPVPSDADGIIAGTLSDRGEVVGTVFHAGSRYAAFVWSSVDGFRVLESGLDSEAKGISGSGAILGYFSAGIGGYGPFLWKFGSIPVEIAAPSLSFGIDINTAGHVAGG